MNIRVNYCLDFKILFLFLSALLFMNIRVNCCLDFEISFLFLSALLPYNILGPTCCMANHRILDERHIHVFSDAGARAGAIADEKSRDSSITKLSRKGAGIILVSIPISFFT